VGERLRNFRAWVFGLALSAGVLALGMGDAVAQSTTGSKPLGSGLKEGWDKLTKSLTPGKTPAETEPVDDAVSLKSKAKPSSQVYVAVGRLYEASGKWPEAEKQYQLALKDNPNDLSALLGSARVKEETGKPEEAIALYQKAAKVNPSEAAVFNNLGLCYARRNMHDEAIASIGRAVLLQPKNPLYRNNIAAVLVEKGRMQEAYSHQRAVHGDAVAYYNLGYLLNKKGKTQEAAQHFAIALQLDPSLVQARHWLQKVRGPASQPPLQAQRPAEGRPTGPIRVGSRPLPPPPDVPNTAPEGGRYPGGSSIPPAPRAPESSGNRDWGPPPSESPPLPPDLAPPVRLPPVTGSPLQRGPEMAPLPGRPAQGPWAPSAAPLPPGN